MTLTDSSHHNYFVWPALQIAFDFVEKPIPTLFLTTFNHFSQLLCLFVFFSPIRRNLVYSDHAGITSLGYTPCEGGEDCVILQYAGGNLYCVYKA